MKRNRLFSTLVGAVIAGAFATGLFEPELRAQGGLPELFSALRPGFQGEELNPWETYNRVLRRINDTYLGELPKDPARPRATSDRLLTYAAIRGLLHVLDDPYTRFLEPRDYDDLRQENQGEFEGIGAQLENLKTREDYVRIVKPISGGPADRAGIRRGDVITHVDGRSVKGMMTVDDAVKAIRGRANTVVRLTILRAGAARPLEFAITRQAVEFEVVTTALKEGNIGYISLGQFNEVADARVDTAIRKLGAQGMKGLILDLRGNPGGLLETAIDVTSRFVPPGRDVVIIVEQGSREARKSNRRDSFYGRMPLAVLVNRTSASASEIVAGAVKDTRAGTVIGTTTFGKGLVQTVVPLEDGSACMITTAKYLTPSGRDINRSREQRGGVEPDVVVDVTEEQWLRGEDPQLRKALEIVRQQIQERQAAPTR